MASSMDTLRDRWENLSPREQRMVVLLVVSFVAILVIWSTLRIRDGLHAIEAKNQKTRLALLALQGYRVHQAHGTDSQDAPLPDTPIKLETYLEGIAGEVNITIPRFNPLPPATRDGFTETQTRIEVRNLSIRELASFLEKVESRSRQVVIKSLDVKRNFRDKEKLDVNLTVSAYSKVSAEEGKKDQDGQDEGAGDDGDAAREEG